MKSTEEVISQLEAASHSRTFVHDTQNLIQGWHSEAGYGAGVVIEGVLKFMESHPEIDFGAPGPLVHRLEASSLELYLPHLLASIDRRPTVHTLGMLNRIINGVGGPLRASLIEDMRAAVNNPTATPAAREVALHFVEYSRKKRG